MIIRYVDCQLIMKNEERKIKIHNLSKYVLMKKKMKIKWGS